MKYILIILVFAIVSLLSCNGDETVEPPTNTDTWERNYPEFGQNRTFSYIAQTWDKGFIIATRDVVIKLTSNGDVENSTQLEGTVYSLIPVNNDLYLLLGGQYNNQEETIWAWCALIESSGDMLWEEIYTSSIGTFSTAITGIENGVNGFTIAGLVGSDYHNSIPDQDQPKLWILNIDTEGNILSEDFLVTPDLQKYHFSQVLIPSDRSGYVLDAEIIGDSSSPLYFKMDNEGKLEWQYTFEPTFRSTRSIIEVNNGDYLFCGSRQTQAFAIRIDPVGNAVFEKYYGEGERKHWANSVAQVSGGFVFAGFTNAKGAGLDDIWVFKTNDIGDLLWDQTFGGTLYDNGSSIVGIEDGGYAATGHISLGDSNYTLWVCKMDENGNSE